MEIKKIQPKTKVIVVMPAYNAEKTIEKTYKDIPLDIVDEILVVDDDSRDKTVQVAKRLKLPVYVHDKNLGYGGNQKTCYSQALKRRADIIVMIHPDYQYDATLTKALIEPIISGRFNVMLGSRIRSRSEAIAGGMPLYKYLSNRFLTLLENIILGLNLSEYHTGFRAFSRKVLLGVPFDEYSDDFIFDQEILIGAHALGFTIGEIPVPVRYFPEASSINFIRSTRYGICILWTLVLYLLHKFGLMHISLFIKRKKNVD